MQLKHLTELNTANCSNYFYNATYRLLLLLLLFVFLFIYTQIIWYGGVFDYFVADNGVKQGAVLSPLLFFVCTLMIYYYCFLKPASVADDIVLIAPTVTALRRLLII